MHKKFEHYDPNLPEVVEAVATARSKFNIDLASALLANGGEYLEEAEHSQSELLDRYFSGLDQKSGYNAGAYIGEKAGTVPIPLRVRLIKELGKLGGGECVIGLYDGEETLSDEEKVVLVKGIKARPGAFEERMPAEVFGTMPSSIAKNRKWYDGKLGKDFVDSLIKSIKKE